MLKPHELIKLLEEVDGRNDKISLVQQNITPELEAGLKIAFDPFIVLGIKKLPDRLFPVTEDLPGNTVKDMFYSMCDSLQNRTLTGHAARDSVLFFANMCSSDEWEYWYKRILQKDLKCGFAVASWNTIAPTPVDMFQCQLATDTPEEEVENQMGKGNVFIEPKFDGVRAIAFVFPKDEKNPEGKVLLYSRNGLLFDNFGVVEDSLLALNLQEPVMLDGEMMSKNFQSLMTQVNRKENVDASDSVYHVFDGMPLERYLQKSCPLTQKQRKEWLEYVLRNRDGVKVVLSPYEYIKDSDVERVKKAFDIVLAEKFEGLMMKDADGKYTFKRGKEWMKIKPFIELTMKVVDVVAGSVGSKYENTMGALVCEVNFEGKDVLVNCGSGFSDQLRAQIWANHTRRPVSWRKKVKGRWAVNEEIPGGKTVVGTLVDVRADGLTQATDSEVWSMRFPRFARFREEWDC